MMIHDYGDDDDAIIRSRNGECDDGVGGSVR